MNERSLKTVADLYTISPTKRMCSRINPLIGAYVNYAAATGSGKDQ
jgi:hypothetical protein